VIFVTDVILDISNDSITVVEPPDGSVSTDEQSIFSALLDHQFSDALKVTVTQSDCDVIDPLYSDFSLFLDMLVQHCPSLEWLCLNRITCQDLFSSFTPHPTESRTLRFLELRFMHVSDEDMPLIGPCFTSVTHLIWYLNRFDEALYEAYVEPYFEIEFENDDGWYPGCEVWGDGQRTQEKNCNVHY
jgi:hypothetical protein